MQLPPPWPAALCEFGGFRLGADCTLRVPCNIRKGLFAWLTKRGGKKGCRVGCLHDFPEGEGKRDAGLVACMTYQKGRGKGCRVGCLHDFPKGGKGMQG
eukprot:1159828-Pelagomonas_calceolata.AAC.10